MSAATGPLSDPFVIDASSADPWFGAETIKSLHELNGFLLTLLVEDVRRPSTDTRLRLAVELSDPLARLDVEARRRVASCPIALVDAGFQNEARWTAVAADTPLPRGAIAPEESFAHLRAIQLAQITLTLASTTAQVSVERACLQFGMTPACAQVLAGLTLHRTQELAERHADWVRPRWEHRSNLWRSLLELAARSPSHGVPPVALRAMQLQLADLALATGVCAAIRQIRR